MSLPEQYCEKLDSLVRRDNVPEASRSFSSRSVNALQKVDFHEIRGRGKGSYIFIHREEPAKGITVPNRKELKRGLLRAIIRQADLTVEEFLKLL